MRVDGGRGVFSLNVKLKLALKCSIWVSVAPDRKNGVICIASLAFKEGGKYIQYDQTENMSQKVWSR